MLSGKESQSSTERKEREFHDGDFPPEILEALISVLSAAVVIASMLNRKSALPFHLPKRRRAIATRDHAVGELFIRPFRHEAELQRVWRRTS
jgi:hypothetical protein